MIERRKEEPLEQCATIEGECSELQEAVQ